MTFLETVATVIGVLIAVGFIAALLHWDYGRPKY